MAVSAAAAKQTVDHDPWRDFIPGDWRNSIDVRDFIVRNFTSYSGDEKFLSPATERTKAVWAKLQPYFQDERKKGVLAVDAKTPSTLLAQKQAISIAVTKSSSGCRPTSHSSVRYSPTVACEWSKPA